MNEWIYWLLSTRVGRRKKIGEVSCLVCTFQENDFEFIPAVKMETNPVDRRVVFKFYEICPIREIGEIVCCFLTKISLFSSCRYCADRAQNLRRLAPNNILIVLQISSESVHFRGCYSRTREHRQNAP